MHWIFVVQLQQNCNSLSPNQNLHFQLPQNLLKDCMALQNLPLHYNPTTMDQFQQVALYILCSYGNVLIAFGALRHPLLCYTSEVHLDSYRCKDMATEPAVLGNTDST
jgi:hypothetical protein